MWNDDYYEDDEFWDDYDNYYSRNSSSKENIKPNTLYLIF